MKAASRKLKAETAAAEMVTAGPKYLTRVELARVLRVSVRKVDSMIANREIPVVRLGTAVRFRLEDVERRLSGTMVTGSEPADGDQRTDGSNGKNGTYVRGRQ